MSNLKATVKDLYTGASRRSVRFRLALIIFDLATVIYFIAVTPWPDEPWMHVVNGLIFPIILLDFVARFWIAEKRWNHLGQVYVIADALVLLSLIGNRFVGVDLSFLRILRALRLGHSNYLLQDLRRNSGYFRLHDESIIAALNLLVFVFFTATAVFTLFVETAQGMNGYVDSLYFTVTTLTTTGYGDLTPNTTAGKFTAMAIMVIGVTLFIRLGATVFRPSKIFHRCTTCGLTRHDADAVHCKHCGETVNIETPGLQ